MSRYSYCLGIIIALSLGSQFTLAQQSEELPRRAFLGVQASPLPEEQQASVSQGVNIARVFPDSTASAPETIFEDEQLRTLAPSVGYQEETQQLFGRHYTFVKELAQTNIMSYWEELQVPTLLMWGRGDYIASEADQQLIRDILQSNEVDVELQYLDVDHYWQEAGDFATAWGNLRNGNRPPINTSVYSSIIDWLSARG